MGRWNKTNAALLNGHYLGALKASAEMAEVLGENDFADECRAIFASGKAWTDKHLFNGEYYFQQIDLTDKTMLEKFARNDTDRAVDDYWNEEHCEIKYQIGEGCEIDMTLPQWYASLYGLGEVLDPDQTRKTLSAIFHHNFKSSMRDVANPWRNYALNDEAGVQICTWPSGKRKPVIPVPYASETMHGFEWAAACNMLQHGLFEEGMAVIKAIRARYDGERRNPWNEFECGSNYARSMASYALLHAFSGFRFDRTRGMIGFAPLLNDGEFRCFWSLGTVWGEYLRIKNEEVIVVKYGVIELHELELSGKVRLIRQRQRELPFDNRDARIILHSPVTIEQGGELVITH